MFLLSKTAKLKVENSAQTTLRFSPIRYRAPRRLAMASCRKRDIEKDKWIDYSERLVDSYRERKRDTLREIHVETNRVRQWDVRIDVSQFTQILVFMANYINDNFIVLKNVVEHASKFSQNSKDFKSVLIVSLTSVMAELLTILWFFTI